MTGGGLTAESLTPGTLLQDTYRILRRVGEGGMGEVYEAAHARLPGRFAVKLLLREVAANPEAFARFRREAEITSALRHPNIVQVVDFNQLPDGSPYIVMEFLDGRDLANFLQGGRRLSLAETIAIVMQVASGLAAAHSQGIVHRDLKPQNIYLVPVVGQDQVFAKIVDFGISKVKTATRNLTREAAVLGTPQYMSPEQALGRGAEVDAKTDQFALAAITYEMLAGQEAFAGENLPAVLYQVVHEEPPAMAIDHPAAEAVNAVIRRGLSKKSGQRFPTVLDYAKALAEGASSPSTSVPAPGWSRWSRPSVETDATVVALPPRPAESVVSRTREEPSAPKPTTFGSTAGEIVNPEIGMRTRRRNIVIAASGGVLVAVVAGFFLLRTPHPRPVSVPVAAASRPTAVPMPPRPAQASRADVKPLPSAEPSPSVVPQPRSRKTDSPKLAVMNPAKANAHVAPPSPGTTAERKSPLPSPPAVRPATQRKKGSVLNDF